MKLRVAKIIAILTVFITILSASGVYATWYYTHGPNPGKGEIQTGLKDFYYGPPETIYISKVEVVSSSSTVSNLIQTPSLPTKLISSASIGASGSSITYKITIHNNTDITYWYTGIHIIPNIPNNSLLGINGGIAISTKDKLQDSGYTFDTNDWVLPRTERDFYAIYTFGNLATGDITTMVDFRFGLKMDSVYDGFLKILNDKISENGYYYLAQVFNDKYAQTGSDIIANVGAEKEIFDRLFGGNLYVDINGTQTLVTVMIQRKDVDGTTNGDSYSGSGTPSGCEYSLFISIPSQNAEEKATVYAVSYTCQNTGASTGTWYQIGQLYEGTADIADYGGVEDGAFDANSWKASPKEYNLGNGLVYKVGYEQGNHFEIMKSLSELMSARDSEFGNKINGNPLFTNVYRVVKGNQYSNDPAIVNLRNAWNDIEPYFVIYNDGGTIWYDSNRCTRSEILPYLVHLADAYDYYLQVHG